jgi:RES domain-containing protein
LILYRVFPRERRAAAAEPGGPLWWPKGLQGGGRHDNPDLYACIYASETRVSPIAERLAPFRGTGDLQPEMLLSSGRPLALATLSLPDGAELVDLDDPRSLVRERLRPSEVATRERPITQTQAVRLYERHPDASGLRWWSSLESRWINITLFDRSARELAVEGVQQLDLEDEAVQDAADFLGLAV